MPTAPPPEDFAKRFGFEATPESVRRLSEMIARRSGNMDDFASIVAQDDSLSARLLAAANPRATRKEDYSTTTVGDAVQRIGMSFALLLAMSDPLIRAVSKTFHTMLEVDLKTVPVKSLPALADEHVLGEVSFAGKTTGLVDLRLPLNAIPVIGERVLGLGPDDLADPTISNDLVGEMANMIVGNFKSNLCDAGLECTLSSPRIGRTKDFVLKKIKGGTSERYAFSSAEINFFADLSVNPWVDCWK